MKIIDLKKQAEYAYRCYERSYSELRQVTDYYHGRHWDIDQWSNLAKDDIPPAPDNLVKQYAHTIKGHFDSILNTVTVRPQQQEDVAIAEIFNDLVNFIFRQNAIDTDEGSHIILQALLSGVCSAYCAPIDTGKTDEFDRPIYDVEIKHVHMSTLILDPVSKALDYSDARFIHRVMNMSEQQLKASFPDANLDKIKKGQNSITLQNDNTSRNNLNLYSEYGCHDELYNVIHSCVLDEDGTWKSIYWCGNEILDEQKLTYNKVKMPYLIYKLHAEDYVNEFYGLFRDTIFHQDIVNRTDAKSLAYCQWS